MNLEEIRDICLRKKYATESFPFDKNTLVFKVFDKMFLLVDLESFPYKISIKCDVENAIELVEKHDFITPARYFNKKHWISITLKQEIENKFIEDCINNSYNEVVKKFTKKLQKEFFN